MPNPRTAAAAIPHLFHDLLASCATLLFGCGGGRPIITLKSAAQIMGSGSSSVISNWAGWLRGTSCPGRLSQAGQRPRTTCRRPDSGQRRLPGGLIIMTALGSVLIGPAQVQQIGNVRRTEARYVMKPDLMDEAPAFGFPCKVRAEKCPKAGYLEGWKRYKVFDFQSAGDLQPAMSPVKRSSRGPQQVHQSANWLFSIDRLRHRANTRQQSSQQTCHAC